MPRARVYFSASTTALLWPVNNGLWSFAIGGFAHTLIYPITKTFVVTAARSACSRKCGPHGNVRQNGALSFVVLGPFDGNAATVGIGSMQAIKLGGADEGGPSEPAPKAYFSYCRYLDGDKLCAFCFG